MAKKSQGFDAKQFLIQKGEKIVLILALGFMALMVTVGFIMNGLGAGSAAANADDLAKLRKQDKDQFDRSTPTADIGIIDPELLQAGVMSPLVPAAYAVKKPYFTPLMADDNRWRKPDVLAPDEFQVDLVRGLVKTYMFGPGYKTVRFLVPRDKAKNANLPAGIPGAGGGRGGNPFMGQSQRLGRGLGGMGGGRGLPGMMGAAGDLEGGGMPGGDGMDAAGGGAKEEMAYLEVPVDRLEKGDYAPPGPPAERTVPVRMAVIQAAFPLKNQMEEFRRALRFATLQHMETEISPEFAGLRVERRTFDLNGREKKGWEPVDLMTELRPFLMFGAEPEDPLQLGYGLVWPRDRLVVPRPMLARDQEYPRTHLKGIAKTMEDIKQVLQGPPLPPDKVKTRFSKSLSDFDVFENTTGGMNAMMGAAGDLEGGGMPGAGAGRMMDPRMARGRDVDDPKAMGRGASMPPGMAMAPGGARPGAMGGAPGASGLPAGAAMGMLEQQTMYPDRVLVRFTDPSVKPGNIYEYQITIRMKNPLYGKEDKAVAKSQTLEPEIASLSAVIPQKLVVPHEFEFYMVAEDPKLFRDFARETSVQIHRWLDNAPNAIQNPSRIPVGDWSIVKQARVFRGEFIGKYEEMQVPTWFPLQQSFMLAAPPDSRKPRRSRKDNHIPVDFNTGHILVDFHGGPQRFLRKDGTVLEDSSELDALVLTRDGRLILRNSKDDTDNKERKERLEAWKEWIAEVDTNTGYKPHLQQLQQSQMRNFDRDR